LPVGAHAEPLSADAPFPAQRRWAAALLVVSVVFRLILLFHSQRFLQSDEALVGMIGLDILEGKPIPLFPYGNIYGGGHIVEALVMVPLFKLFGPCDWIVAGVPAMSACLFMGVVYATLYRFFSKRLALVATAILSFSCAFVTYNYYVNGSMTTMLFAWLGMYFFFSHYYGDRPRPGHLVLAGAALGFAVYCFDYALFNIAAIAGLLLLRHRLGIFRQWKALAALVAGGVIGLSPIIIHDLNHHFEILSRYVGLSGTRGPSPWSGAARRFLNLWIHDLPAFFSTEIYDFPLRISGVSMLAYALFTMALLYMMIQLRGPLLAGLRNLRQARTAGSDREARMLCILYLITLYVAIYSLSIRGGLAPRYLLPLYPPIPIVIAWALLRLARTRPGWMKAFAVLFMATQAWFIVPLALDQTTTEWRITTHGKDIRKIVNFLEKRGLTTVMAPYEIKWKLMFASNRRIICAAISASCGTSAASSAGGSAIRSITLCATLTAWSPMRSRSALLLIMARTKRRSTAMGCCMASRSSARLSISRSARLMCASFSKTFWHSSGTRSR
jgi:4-amino-4-deoxy-L-arabinose transferase-like glycosyltransferase